MKKKDYHINVILASGGLFPKEDVDEERLQRMAEDAYLTDDESLYMPDSLQEANLTLNLGALLPSVSEKIQDNRDGRHRSVKRIVFSNPLAKFLLINVSSLIQKYLWYMEILGQGVRVGGGIFSQQEHGNDFFLFGFVSDEGVYRAPAFVNVLTYQLSQVLSDRYRVSPMHCDLTEDGFLDPDSDEVDSQIVREAELGVFFDPNFDEADSE